MIDGGDELAGVLLIDLIERETKQSLHENIALHEELIGYLLEGWRRVTFKQTFLVVKRGVLQEGEMLYFIKKIKRNGETYLPNINLHSSRPQYELGKNGEKLKRGALCNVWNVHAVDILP